MSGTVREQMARALFVVDAMDAGIAQDRAEAAWSLCAADAGDICARDSRRLADAALSVLRDPAVVAEVQQAAFHALRDAGVSFESATVVPAVTQAVIDRITREGP